MSGSGARAAGGAWFAVIVAVACRPWLWLTAARQILLLASPGWWRRGSRLPIPAPAYLRFRLQTAYGDPQHAPRPEDLVAYLCWCRAWSRVTDRSFG